MHSVAIDNFEHAKFWLGNYGEFTLKDPFIAAVLGRLFFAFVSAVLKFCSDFTPPHMLPSVAFRSAAPTPRFHPFARSGFLEGEISRLSRTPWRASARRRFRGRSPARAASRA